MQFLRDVGRRVAAETEEPRSLQFLLQCASVAVQRGCAASVIDPGTTFLFAGLVTLNLPSIGF
jgi:hypothetical protein